MLAYNTVKVYSIYVDKIKEDEMNREMTYRDWISENQEYEGEMDWLSRNRGIVIDDDAGVDWAAPVLTSEDVEITFTPQSEPLVTVR